MLQAVMLSDAKHLAVRIGEQGGENLSEILTPASNGGAEGGRTLSLLIANQALSH